MPAAAPRPGDYALRTLQRAAQLHSAKRVSAAGTAPAAGGATGAAVGGRVVSRGGAGREAAAPALGYWERRVSAAGGGCGSPA
mmetsp:Transcript_20664/g.44971  ORF Transcript_20664/g.44971 Transcript_20664/m.44971 type:complete len:83 (-) Transcript_20664:12-260(-)